MFLKAPNIFKLSNIYLDMLTYIPKHEIIQNLGKTQTGKTNIENELRRIIHTKRI